MHIEKRGLLFTYWALVDEDGDELDRFDTREEAVRARRRLYRRGWDRDEDSGQGFFDWLLS